MSVAATSRLVKSMSRSDRAPLLLAAIAFACVPLSSVRAEPTAQETSVDRTADNGCVANLPFARGAVFCCLDEYLAHLQQQGAIDLPWWREISPGVYEHVRRMPESQREVATREELMQRFGFRC